MIDLFSGIGGFSLAGKWIGWKTIQFCEIDPFCQRVLAYHFPNAPIHDDIKTLDYEAIKNRMEPSEPSIIVGGFPCQPYSLAGKRKGTEDNRHLWPEMLRAIREIQPSYVVAENVYGLVNWNGGLVFHEIQTDLEAEGYQVQPVILPACGVNAPHRRDRIWFVAYSTSNGKSRQNREGFETKRRRKTIDEQVNGGQCKTIQPKGLDDIPQSATNTKPKRLQGKNGKRMGTTIQPTEQFTPNATSDRSSRKEHRQEKTGFNTETNQGCRWEDFPTQSPICNRDDGFSDRLVGITFPKWRNESIKAMGNAIVPQVAYEIFKVIDKIINET